MGSSSEHVRKEFVVTGEHRHLKVGDLVLVPWGLEEPVRGRVVEIWGDPPSHVRVQLLADEEDDQDREAGGDPPAPMDTLLLRPRPAIRARTGPWRPSALAAAAAQQAAPRRHGCHLPAASGSVDAIGLLVRRHPAG